jgi:two-component system, NtrC family, response regulator GlrR
MSAAFGRVVDLEEAAARRERVLVGRDSFGELVGRSAAMRAALAVLERAAPTEAKVLLEGETGTGKSEAARALHAASRRRSGPLVVVDCGALSDQLLDSELFGHEKGAFTGAHARRIGALEEASGGTVFLDEIGELPLSLQPKLLRALEERQIRRVGSNAYRPIDVRVIAATHRDLGAEVTAGGFRADLYFRLAVVRVALPPLRQRAEDVPLIAERLLRGLGAGPSQLQHLLRPEHLGALSSADWPGNVRELRNHLQRCLVLGLTSAPERSPAPAAPDSHTVDPTIPYAVARRAALDAFERAYAGALLASQGGKVTAAAEAAGLNRVYLHKLLRRHGLR